MRDDRTWNSVIRLTRNDHRSAAGQQPAYRFISPASHDDVMSHREPLEELQLLGQMPRDPVVRADDAIFRHGDDQRDCWASGCDFVQSLLPQ
jgi:hypothetical protein